MAATYFSLPSFARAKKHTEELAKTSPTKPVLNEEDEKFLERITSAENKQAPDVSQAQISDDGQVKETNTSSNDDQVIFPGKQPDEVAEDPPESVPDDNLEQAPILPPRPKSKKDDFVELPSQEDAEAATKGFSTATVQSSDDEKKTWASYIPSIPSLKKDTSPKDSDEKGRTWSDYASSMVPASWTRTKDAKPEPVLNEDGSINEEATKEKEEKEISVLLDNLNLSSINNRVFAFSEESQKFYERFVQALKDTINGVPTAYHDMEQLMKEAGPTIERQWNAMPPFVQTLVKALPAKLSTSVAPGLLAAIGEKPGHDAKMMDAASSKASSGGDAGIKSKSKKKRQIVPGLKGLVKKQGLAATMLRNISIFLKTRFPLLAGASSVLMSLSVFILMFVFYYCWRRGREVRLAKEKEAAATNDGAEDDDDDIEIDVTDEEGAETPPSPSDGVSEQPTVPETSASKDFGHHRSAETQK